MTTPTAPGSDHKWARPHLPAIPPTAARVVFAALLVLSVVGTGCDAILLKTPVDFVVNETDTASWIVAGGFAVLAAFAMLEAGHLYHKSNGAPRRSLPMILCLTAWAGFGIAVTLIRATGSNAAAQPIQLSGITIPAAHASNSWWLACVLAAFYLGSGLVNFATGTHLFNPVAHGYNAGRRTAAKLAQHRIPAARGRAARHLEHLEDARGQHETIPALRRAAASEIWAFAEEAMQHARLRILTPRGPIPLTVANIPPTQTPRTATTPSDRPGQNS